MTNAASHGTDEANANLELAGPGWRLKTTLTVPTAPRRLRQLLPMVQALTNSVVDAAAQREENQGQAVSCTKGCGACCRQMVPIAEAEARHVAALVDDLPEPRRTQVRRRFAEALRRLSETAMLAKLKQRATWTEAQRQPLGLEYFHLGIACPFLEDESCSIHGDRPLACREYLVTSPAANCAQPTKESVRSVPLPLKVSAAFRSCESDSSEGKPARWVPLVLALDWAASNPNEPPPRSGPEFVEILLARLTGKNFPGRT